MEVTKSKAHILLTKHNMNFQFKFQVKETTFLSSLCSVRPCSPTKLLYPRICFQHIEIGLSQKLLRLTPLIDPAKEKQKCETLAMKNKETRM